MHEQCLVSGHDVQKKRLVGVRQPAEDVGVIESQGLRHEPERLAGHLTSKEIVKLSSGCIVMFRTLGRRVHPSIVLKKHTGGRSNTTDICVVLAGSLLPVLIYMGVPFHLHVST